MATLNLKKIAKARSLLKTADNKNKIPTIGMGLHGSKELKLADGGEPTLESLTKMFEEAAAEESRKQGGKIQTFKVGNTTHAISRSDKPAPYVPEGYFNSSRWREAMDEITEGLSPEEKAKRIKEMEAQKEGFERDKYKTRKKKIVPSSDEMHGRMPSGFADGGEVCYAEGGYVVRRTNERKGKTHVVENTKTGEKQYFGDPNLKNRPNNPEAKKAYYARHAKNIANNPFFAAYSRATWDEGGMVEMASGGKLKKGDPDTYITKEGKETKRGLWANVYLKKKREGKLADGGMVADQTTMAGNLKMQYGKGVRQYADGEVKVEQLEPEYGEPDYVDPPTDDSINIDADSLTQSGADLDVKEGDVTQSEPIPEAQLEGDVYEPMPYKTAPSPNAEFIRMVESLPPEERSKYYSLIADQKPLDVRRAGAMAGERQKRLKEEIKAAEIPQEYSLRTLTDMLEETSNPTEISRIRELSSKLLGEAGASKEDQARYAKVLVGALKRAQARPAEGEIEAPTPTLAQRDLGREFEELATGEGSGAAKFRQPYVSTAQPEPEPIAKRRSPMPELPPSGMDVRKPPTGFLANIPLTEEEAQAPVVKTEVQIAAKPTLRVVKREDEKPVVQVVAKRPPEPKSFADIIEAAPSAVVPEDYVSEREELSEDAKDTPLYQAFVKEFAKIHPNDPAKIKALADSAYRASMPTESEDAEAEQSGGQQKTKSDLDLDKTQYDNAIAQYSATQALADEETDPQKKSDLLQKAATQLKIARIQHARLTGVKAGADFDKYVRQQQDELAIQADIAKRQNQITTAYKMREMALEQKASAMFQARFAEYQSQADALRQQIATAKVDPKRYVDNIGTIRYGLGVLLGSLARAGGAQTSVMDFVEKKVQQDLDLQLKDIDRKKNLLSSYVSAGNSLTNAYKLAKADLKDIVAGEMEVALANVQDAQTMSKMRQAQAKLGQDAMKLRAEAVKGAIDDELIPDRLMAQLNKAGDLEKLELARERIKVAREAEQGRSARARQADVRKGQALTIKATEAQEKEQEKLGGSAERQAYKAGMPVKASEVGSLPPAEAELMVNVPNHAGYRTAAKTKEDATKLKDAEKLRITAEQAANRLEEIFNEAGGTIPLGATGRMADLRAEAVALQEGLLSSLTKLLETGTINGGDYSRLKTFIPSIDDWSRDKTIAGKFRGFRDVLKRNYEAGYKVFLRNPDIENSFDAAGRPKAIEGFQPRTAPSPLPELTGGTRQTPTAAPPPKAGKKREVKIR